MAEEQAALPTEEQEMEEEKETAGKDDESDEEESGDEEYFEVEKIMARKKRDGIFLYRVRWKGYPPSNDTWEPVDNLEVVEDMIEEFDAKEDEKTKARQEERRLRKLRMEGKKLPGEESSDSSNSSDDERLLSEDTKFFKMLEKNKDIVFGQPDLYSKVKSRAATLASKKKTESNKAETSTAKSRTAQLQSSKKESSRGSSRRSSEGTQSGQKSGRRRGHKKTLSESYESDDSVVQLKPTGRQKVKLAKKVTVESSEEDVDSDYSPSHKTSSRRAPCRPQRKALIDDPEEKADASDDSIPLAKQFKRGRGRKRRRILFSSSGDSTPDRPSHVEASDSMKPEPAKKAQTNQTSESKQVNHTDNCEIDKRPNLFSKFEKSAASEATVTRESSVSVSQYKGDKSSQKASCHSSDSSDLAAKSVSNKTSLPTPVQPRVIVQVLEKLAQSSLPKIEDEQTQNVSGEKPPITSQKTVEEDVKNCEIKSTFVESMEMELSERRQDRKGGKKKNSSRKRKLDAAVEHARAVSEGQASPLKLSPRPPSPCERPPSPGDIETSAADSNPPILSLETTIQEAAHPNMDTDDVTLANASPPVLQKHTTEKKVPPLRISVPNLKIGPPSVKAESLKPYNQHHGQKSTAVSSKEKQKLKGDGLKTVRHDRHSSSSITKSVPTSKQQSSRDHVLESSSSVTLQSSNLSLQTSGTAFPKKDWLKLVNDFGLSQVSKSDLITKTAKSATTESGYVKLECVGSRLVKSEVGDKTMRIEHLDQKTAARTEDFRKKYSSSSDFSSSTSTGISREPPFSIYAQSSVRDSQGVGRDSSLSTVRSTSTVFSSASTSRDTSSLYLSARDPCIPGRGIPSVRDPSHMSSYKDQHLSSSSGRDFHLGSGSSGDIRLGAGYIHLSSGSSRESFSTSSRDSQSHYIRGDPKEGCAGGSRHNLNSCISGKENADRQHSIKSLSSVPKKGDGMQPLDTILNSSLYAGDGDKSKQFKGLDSDFELALQRIDLDYLEKLLLPAVTPMELSDEELRQAVMDGNSYLVERALAFPKPYNLNMPDNKGYTLLMNAVLRGSDDIIVHLLSGGADAQVQVNGVTALMLAVEHAESSTVFMLLEMGAHVNTADHSGETALFKAVRRGDKHILKLILDHGANFSMTSRLGLGPLQMAKQFRLADIETTLNDHVQRVVQSFEEQVNLTVRGTAKLVSCLFPHHCVPLYESETITIPFKYQPSMPAGPGNGCLLFIAHARFSTHDVKCRLYGQCAVERVTLNEVVQPCLTEESNFVLMCHPLITGWNELVIHTRKDPTSKAKLIVCAYKAQLIYK